MATIESIPLELNSKQRYNALIDTCVLAEAQRGNSRSTDAIAVLPDESLFLSVLSIGEIRKGINLLDAGKKRRELTAWRATLSSSFSERIIPTGPASHKDCRPWRLD